MKMKTHRLHRAILSALTLGLAMPVAAQSAAEPGQTQPATSPAAQPEVQCGPAGCQSDGDILLRVRTRGERQPVTAPGTPTSSPALQPDRRVTVQVEEPAAPGRATALGKWQVQLPDGGVVWATEDPDLGQPRLSVSAGSMVAYDGGRVVKPVRFYGYSNYGAFIDRAEALIYKATDSDLVSPIAQVPLALGTVIEGEWDGAFADDPGLRVGDELIYIVRVHDKEGRHDETFPRRMQLVRPEELEAGMRRLNESADLRQRSLTAEAAEQLRLIEGTFGENSLRQQNIPVYGSRVRVNGRAIPEGATLSINGQSIPVDLERKFVAEYLLPVGVHEFDVEVRGIGADPQTPVRRKLSVDVSGRYFFAVGLADFTLSGNRVSGSLEPFGPDPRYTKDNLSEGRLAFYAKGKAAGKYLITAHADTREQEVSRMFRGFWDAYPQDIFRRLDPDRYYPTYGDDSTTWRDVDTMGRLYLRVDWDKNQFLWGNYQTGLTGTEFAQYARAFYGAALSWRSQRTTALGDAGTFVRAFGSKMQTAPGHSEFIGTGGSLYYLKHTDVMPGSEQVVLEVRDGATGRVENRVPLLRGVDYEIDEFQGRILLTRPLAQVTRENVRTLTRDTPLDGYQQVLLVDYEYLPRGFSADNVSAGIRAKHWFGDHVGVGITYVDENRAGEDYNLAGADVTLQAGRGTYLKLEQARSEATAAPVFFSDNGGLSFVERNAFHPNTRGTARSVEARVNTRELGWTEREWSFGGWWRKVDAGFSVARFDNGFDVIERGVEVLGDVSDSLRVYARASEAERGPETLRQAQLTADWRINENATLSGELRRVEEQRLGGNSAGTLLAARYAQRIGTSWDVYGIGQFTLDDDGGRYEKNNAVTAGAKYLFGDLSSIGGEVTVGDRGNAAQINGEYRISPEHTVYGSYTYSTDTTAYDPLFNPRVTPGWTLGQRWRLSNQVNLYNESQFLKQPYESGIAHTFGMDFYPGVGWNLGFNLQAASLDRQVGQVDRKAISLNGGRTSEGMQWQSKLEWRRDTGAEERTQWVTTNWLNYKVNESLRLAARLNWSDTQDELNPEAGARFAEGNVGFAWRPWNNTRWMMLGKYTYLYDVSALPQVGPNMAWYDQKSQVLMLEGIWHPTTRWEFAGKLARREGEVRMGRLEGEWADSAATFAALQARWGIGDTDWNLLGEYRWLKVKHGGDRQGGLFAIDRDIGRNFRIGVGYNFTDFSDNLTDFDYRHRGWFLNVSGRY
ncbi:hypothetical protein [Luteimonas sp. e5]